MVSEDRSQQCQVRTGLSVAGRRPGDGRAGGAVPRAVALQALPDKPPDGEAPRGVRPSRTAVWAAPSCAPTSPLENIVDLVGNLRRYGPAFGGLAARLGLAELLAEPERFEKALVGWWPSFEGFITELAEDCGLHAVLEEAPPRLRAYIQVNYSALANDVERDLIVVRNAAEVWVFDPWA